MNPDHAPQHDNIPRGIAHACAAFFLFALMGACSKGLSSYYSIFEVTFYRNIVALIPMTLYVLYIKRLDLFVPLNVSLLGGRVLAGVIGLLLTFSAWKALPMTDATLIFMTANLIVPVLAFFFLKEQIGPYRWGAVVVGFCGVFLVAGPSGQGNAFGVMIAFCAALSHAVIQILLRFLKKENAFTVTYYFIAGGVVAMLPLLPFVAHMPRFVDVPLILGVGISGGLGQYCISNAFKQAPASVISPFNYTGLVWATGLDILIWSKVPDWHVALGGVIIVGAGLFVYARERMKARQDPL